MTENLFKSAVEHAVTFTGVKFEDEAQAISELSEVLEERTNNPIFPGPNDTLAVSISKPKTAALAFDRVYRIPTMNDPIPKSLGYYCATDADILVQALLLTLLSADAVGIERDHTIPRRNLSAAEKETNEKTSLRLLCADQSTRFGLSPTIIYENLSTKNADFQPGSRSVLAASLQNLKIVQEDDLSWKQVEDFRCDSDALKKYRRVVRWIDHELVGKEHIEIEDMIAIRLEDYEWALKKHGLMASIGALSSIIDPKFLSATSAAVGAAALGGGGGWALFAGISLTVGKVVAEFSSTMIEGEDELRKQNYDIAYVHEVKKLR